MVTRRTLPIVVAVLVHGAGCARIAGIQDVVLDDQGGRGDSPAGGAGGAAGAPSVGGNAGEGGVGGVGGAPVCAIEQSVSHWVADSVGGNDGDPVGSWIDETGAHDLMSAGNPPTLALDAIGGHSALRFHDQRLLGALPPDDVAGPNPSLVVLAVVESDDSERDNQAIWSWGEPAHNGPAMFSGFNWYLWGKGVSYSTTTGTSQGTISFVFFPTMRKTGPHVVTSIRDAANHSLVLQFDGSPAGYELQATPLDMQDPTLSIGAWANDTAFWSGFIAEIVIAHGPLDPTSVDAMGACLRDKYDIASPTSK